MKEALLRSSTGSGCTLEDGPSSSSDSERLFTKADTQHSERLHWIVKGEYALTAVLAMIFVYTLAFSHTNHTPFSSSSQHSKHWWKARSDVSGWMEQHQQYVNETVLASESLALQVEFFGDGVVEAWRGSQHGQLSVRCHEGPAIFKGHFGPDYETHAWGIAGDAAQHLMWRLRHGEGLVSAGPQLAVIMIGSNDLTYASLEEDTHMQQIANSTVTRIHAIAQYLSDLRPQSQVLLVGLLPRGDLTVPPDQHLAQPSKFTPAICSINQQLQQLATTREDMHFLDCGDDFTYDGKAGRIHASLMPDGVNLNAAGMEQLATCLQPVIQDIVERMEPTLQKQNPPKEWSPQDVRV